MRPLQSANRRRFQLLLDLLHPAGLGMAPDIHPEDWAGLFMAANLANLTGGMAWRLREHGLWETAPAEVRDYAEGAAELGRLRAEAQRRQALELVKRLEERNIRPILLKGTASLISGLYPDTGARFSSDIDLLIPVERMEEAWSLLVADGYAKCKVEESDLREDHHHAPILLHPDRRFGVELHRHMASAILRNALPADEVRRRAVSLSVDGVTLWIPAMEDRLVQCLTNILVDWDYTYILALRQLQELRLLVSAQPDFDWQGIHRRFAGVGRAGSIGYILQMASELAGLPAPSGIVPPLGGRRGKLFVWLTKEWLFAHQSRLRPLIILVSPLVVWRRTLWIIRAAAASGSPLCHLLRGLRKTMHLAWTSRGLASRQS